MRANFHSLPLDRRQSISDILPSLKQGPTDSTGNPSSREPSKIGFIQRSIGIGSISIFSFFSILGLTFLGTELIGLQPEVSFAIALALIFCANFWLTRNIVFRSRKTERNAGVQLRKCLLVSISFRLGEYMAFVLCVNLLTLPYPIVSSAVLIISFLGKILVYDRYVFT